MLIFSAPIVLHGEGSYAISAVKEVEVSDDFLGLDDDIKKCQTEEPFFNCTTRSYFETYREALKKWEFSHSGSSPSLKVGKYFFLI